MIFILTLRNLRFYKEVSFTISPDFERQNFTLLFEISTKSNSVCVVPGIL